MSALTKSNPNTNTNQETHIMRKPVAFVRDNGRVLAWMDDNVAYVQAEDVREDDLIADCAYGVHGYVRSIEIKAVSKVMREKGADPFRLRMEIVSRHSGHSMSLPTKSMVALEVDYMDTWFELGDSINGIISLLPIVEDEARYVPSFAYMGSEVMDIADGQPLTSELFANYVILRDGIVNPAFGGGEVLTEHNDGLASNVVRADSRRTHVVYENVVGNLDYAGR